MARLLQKFGIGVAAVVAVSLLAAAVYHVATPGRGSLAMKMAEQVLRLRGKPLADTQAFENGVLHRGRPVAAPMPVALRDKANVSEQMIAGYPVIKLRPRSGAGRRHIIYLHGGAYVSELTSPHWDIIAALIAATGATVSVPLYPLAPEHDHRPAFAFLDAVYRQALSVTPASNIVLAGDSAGAGLALGVALAARSDDLPLPGRIILFSPWLDLSLADPETAAIEPDDAMLAVEALRLCGQWWAGGTDTKSPILSPLYADLTGLPPIDLYQGTHDIFIVDSRHFAAKARLAGTPIHYKEFPGAFHVFVGAPFLPEARQVFHHIGATLAAPPAAAQ